MDCILLWAELWPGPWLGFRAMVASAYGQFSSECPFGNDTWQCRLHRTKFSFQLGHPGFIVDHMYSMSVHLGSTATSLTIYIFDLDTSIDEVGARLTLLTWLQI